MVSTLQGGSAGRVDKVRSWGGLRGLVVLQAARESRESHDHAEHGLCTVFFAHD